MHRKAPHYVILFILMLRFLLTFSYFFQHHVLEHPVSLNLAVTSYTTKEIQAE